MSTSTATDIEIVSVEPEGWCSECCRFGRILTVLVHIDGFPGEFADVCGSCIDDRLEN